MNWPWNENRQTESEPSFWSFDWFSEHSANAILMDFETSSFNAVFWLVGRTILYTQLVTELTQKINIPTKHCEEMTKVTICINYC